MSVRTDVINLQVNVQGNSARNELNELKKKAVDLSFELKGMQKNTAEYIAKSKELAKVELQMSELKKQIGLTSLSIKELNQEQRKLRALVNSADPLSKEYKDLEAQLRAVINRQRELKAGFEGFGNSSSIIKDVTKNLSFLAASYFGFQFIFQQIGNIIKGSAALSDKLADIQRVTGLTNTEVEKLNTSLLALDTRTSLEGLQNIAVVAGKLGVAKGDILDFTKSVDMLVVALGDELGDADQITTSLGKILNVFEGKITGQNISELGNAIVDLANKGVASGPFLVDFAQRVAGIAKTANLSLASVLGLAAGLEESGARVESSSTAIQKLISDIASDLPKAAKIAGESVADFQKLFGENPQEALLRYAEGLQKNKASFADVAKSFKDAGEDGARTVAVLATLGQKTDFFRQKMQDAGFAIKNTSEITEAFRLKNETLGAEMDKLGKRLSNAFINSGFTKFLTGAAKGLNDLIEPAKSATQKFDELSKEVSALTDNILPLADRYDTLKTKTKLSSGEQAEMKSIISQITAIMPGAVTQFDEYGNAIAISTSRVRDFISAEKDRLQVVNKSAIEENQQKLIETAKQIEFLSKDIKDVSEKGTFTVTESSSGGTGGASTLQRKATQEEIAALEQKNKQLLSEYRGYFGEIKRLNGQALQEQIDANKKALEDNKTTTDTITTDLTDSEKNKYKAALDAFRDFIKNIDDAILENQIPEQAKKVINVLQQTRDELAKLEDFKSKGVVSTTEYIAAYDKILAQQKTAIQKLVDDESKNFKPNVLINDSILGRDFPEHLKSAFEKLKKVTVDLPLTFNTDITPEEQKQLSEKLKHVFDRFQRDQRAGDQVAVNNANGIGARTEALEKQLKDEHDLEMQNTDLTNNERILKEQQYQRDRLNIILEGIAEELDYAQQVYNTLSAFEQAKSSKETAALNRELRGNDVKKASYKKQLDGKLLSESQYNKKVQELDAENESKKDALAKKQFERNKKFQIAQAGITGAQNVLKTISDFGLPFPPNFLGIAAMALNVGTTLASISAISRTDYAGGASSYGDGGRLDKGPYHSDKEKGLHVVDPRTGKTEMLLEKDEAVINGRAIRATEKITVSGTANEIASAINNRYGGVAWTGGAVLSMPKWRSERPVQVNPNMPRIMAAGGTISQQQKPETNDATSETNTLLRMLIAKQDAQTEEIKTMKTKLHAVVSIKEFRIEEAKYNAARKASSLG